MHAVAPKGVEHMHAGIACEVLPKEADGGKSAGAPHTKFPSIVLLTRLH